MYLRLYNCYSTSTPSPYINLPVVSIIFHQCHLIFRMLFSWWKLYPTKSLWYPTYRWICLCLSRIVNLLRTMILCSWIHGFSFPCFQGDPVQILPWLYLGNVWHASQDKRLISLGVTAQLNVSQSCNTGCPASFISYKAIPVEDNCIADISCWFPEAIDFIGK